MGEKVVIPRLIYKFYNFVLDPKQKLLLNENRVIPLNQKSFECLLLLVENAGQVVLKEEFFDKIWQDSFVEDGVLAVNIFNLRKILESEQKQKIIETLPRRGYRFIAKIEIEYPDLHENPSESKKNPQEFNKNIASSEDQQLPNPLSNFDSQNTNHTQKSGRLQLSRFQILGSILLFTVLVTAVYFVYQKFFSNNSDSKIEKVSAVIFPFENVSGNQDLDYLSLSLADSLIYSLGAISHVKTVPTSSVKRFVGQSYNSTEEASKFKVDNIITGSYRTENTKIIVDIQIKDTSKDPPLVQQQQFTAVPNDLTTLRTSVFKFLIQGLSLNRTDYELIEIQKLETQNPLAFEYYLKGSTAYFNSQFDSSISFYNKALELDPNFLLALEGLATNYLQKGSLMGCGASCYQKSLEYREKIVQLAPEYERGKLNLALLYVDSNQLERALSLVHGVLKTRKDSQHGLFVLAYSYRYAGMLEESIKATEISQNLGGQDTTTSVPVTTHIYSQNYEKFLQTFHSPPTNPYGLFYKGLAQYYLKNKTDAKNHFDNAYNISSNLLTSKIGKVFSYHIENRNDASLKLLNETKDVMMQNQVNDGEMIYKLAQAYAELKQLKEALEMFSLSVDKGFVCFPYFVNDPLIDNIRKEPQFEVIMKKAQSRHENIKNQFPFEN